MSLTLEEKNLKRKLANKKHYEKRAKKSIGSSSDTDSMTSRTTSYNTPPATVGESTDNMPFNMMYMMNEINQLKTQNLLFTSQIQDLKNEITILKAERQQCVIRTTNYRQPKENNQSVEPTGETTENVEIKLPRQVTIKTKLKLTEYLDTFETENYDDFIQYKDIGEQLREQVKTKSDISSLGDTCTRATKLFIEKVRTMDKNKLPFRCINKKDHTIIAKINGKWTYILKPESIINRLYQYIESAMLTALIYLQDNNLIGYEEGTEFGMHIDKMTELSFCSSGEKQMRQKLEGIIDYIMVDNIKQFDLMGIDQQMPRQKTAGEIEAERKEQEENRKKVEIEQLRKEMEEEDRGRTMKLIMERAESLPDEEIYYENEQPDDDEEEDDEDEEEEYDTVR